MTTIISGEELLRRAVKWIGEQRAETGKPLHKLIDEAAMKFNLGPKDTEFLVRFFKDNPDADQATL